MDNHSMKVAGIDTGKLELEVCLLPEEACFKVKNDASGVAALMARCRAAGVTRCAIEATSIYHRRALRALRLAGFEVAEVQPRQARRFAEALLRFAKTDKIDARVIARLAQIIDTPHPGCGEAIEKLAEDLTYIEHLEERAAWLASSRERYEAPRFLAKIEADIKDLERCRKAELRRLEARMRRDPALARKLDLLLSIPGVAERSAIGFLIRMPELGSLTRGQVGKLAGLAPLNDDSAKRQGERHIYGGRARLRRTAFMAAFAAATHWNEDLKAFHRRLRARGKEHKQAIVACARKLLVLANAILARGTPWQESRVMP